MKAFIYLSLAAIALAACNGSQSTPTESADEDTTAVTTTSAEEPKATSGDDFTSPDLSFFSLHGPVHTLTEDGNEYVFDKKGTLLTINGRDPFQGPDRDINPDDGSFEELVGYTRDADGYIEETSTWESSSEIQWADGRVIGEVCEGEGMEGVIQYTYNADGTLARTEEQWHDEGMTPTEEPFITTFSRYKKDAHGNWIQRTRSHANSDDVQKRTITYYGE